MVVYHHFSLFCLCMYCSHPIALPSAYLVCVCVCVWNMRECVWYHDMLILSVCTCCGSTRLGITTRSFVILQQHHSWHYNKIICDITTRSFVVLQHHTVSMSVSIYRWCFSLYVFPTLHASFIICHDEESTACVALVYASSSATYCVTLHGGFFSPVSVSCIADRLLPTTEHRGVSITIGVVCTYVVHLVCAICCLLVYRSSVR